MDGTSPFSPEDADSPMASVQVASEEVVQEDQLVPLQAKDQYDHDLQETQMEAVSQQPQRRMPTGFELRRSESSQDPYMFNPYTGEQ